MAVSRNTLRILKDALRVERNMVTISAKETETTNVERNVARDIAGIKPDREGRHEAVTNEVGGLEIALIEGPNENKTKITNAEGGDKENIIVAGGYGTDSVEMFNWHQRTWSPLQSMPNKRHGVTSFVYNNHMTVAGGYSSDYVEDMIRINISPDLPMFWSDCPVELPAGLRYHSSVLYNDHLMVTGGYDGNAVSDCIHEVQLVPPYTVTTLLKMPETRQYHCMEIFDDCLLIVGGRTTSGPRDNLSSIVLYDIKKNECIQLTPLPYEVEMATVRWGDNIIVIGGINKHGEALDTVIIYNVKTEKSHTLPPMRRESRACTAVVIGNNIVVVGGRDNQFRDLKSVEAFNFESYTWQELPEMSQARRLHTAVVV